MYLEYHELLKKYKEASRRYNEALEERSKLITNVLPKASQFKEVVTFGGNASPDAKLIDYTNEIDEIDKLINQSRNTRDMINYELKKMAIEMQISSDVLDKVYYYRWIEHKNPVQFYRLISYSIPQTYRFIDEIKKNLYQN